MKLNVTLVGFAASALLLASSGAKASLFSSDMLPQDVASTLEKLGQGQTAGLNVEQIPTETGQSLRSTAEDYAETDERQRALDDLERSQAEWEASPEAEEERKRGSKFSPINPPSIPLAVKGFYLNTWAPSGQLPGATPPNVVGNGGYLAGQSPSFWTSSYGADGEFRMAWTGLVRVDNTTYQWMGDAFGTTLRKGKNARQISMTYTATKTLFEFEAAGVLFNVTFLTPITPDDYLRQSLPLSYLHIEFDRQSIGNKTVQLYTDIDERWVTGYDYDYEEVPYTSLWTDNTNGTSSYFIQRTNPLVYTEKRQRAEWGSVSYAARRRPGMSSRNNNNVITQLEFLTRGEVVYDHNPVGGPKNAFSYSFDMNAKGGGDDALLAIGHFRSPYVSYIRPLPNANGSSPRYYFEDRYGYWMSEFPAFQDAIAFFLNDFEDARAKAAKLDAKIEKDAEAVLGGGDIGKQNAALAALSVRQAFATLEFTVSYNATSKQYNTSDTLVFLKEISSNGDCATTDVIFPMFPLLTYLNPDLLRLTLAPLMEYQDAGLYPNKWAAHDLGVTPKCNGHPDGNEEIMQVEESGNMIGMIAHWAQLVGAKEAKPYLKHYYGLLTQWAEFLIEDSLVPAEQLSTDDFAGTLANQTNLALKGILGIGAMAEISATVGNTTDSTRYRKIAESYIDKWETFAISNATAEGGSKKKHTVLAYQTPSSWGTPYNIYLNDLLNLNLVKQRVYDIGSDFFPDVLEKYGLPLDSRHKWAKSDWAYWMSTAVSTKVRDELIGRLFKFYSSDRLDAPMTDLYETTTGDFPKEPFDPRVWFMARPVVGGHFAHQALSVANEANGVKKPRYGPKTEGLAKDADGKPVTLKQPPTLAGEESQPLDKGPELLPQQKGQGQANAPPAEDLAAAAAAAGRGPAGYGTAQKPFAVSYGKIAGVRRQEKLLARARR